MILQFYGVVVATVRTGLLAASKVAMVKGAEVRFLT